MKNKYINSLFGICLLSLLVCSNSCKKLDFQDKFEFEPELPELTPYKDSTALQFIMADPKNEFTYLRQAIALTGMQDEYSSNTTKRTYFLLKDAAFKNSGQVMQALTGNANGNLATVNVERIRHLLKYHILENYVDQGPEYTKKLNEDYFFQSLIPGDTGRVSIRRNVFLAFALNSSPLLPVTKKGTNQIVHNYVFKNGIAHLLNTQYIRAVPF